MTKRKIVVEEDFDDELEPVAPPLVEEIEEQPDMEIDACEVETESQVLIEEETDFDIIFKSSSNKHKLDGKHALKRDTIFKGKLESEVDEDGNEEHLTCFIETSENSHYQIQAGSLCEQESRYQQDYLNQKNLAKDVFDLLTENTELDFRSNRRKPNRQTFNAYYKMLLDAMETKYTQSEIFVELSYYFTDNIFNMFKLLDKKYATSIIVELKHKGYLQDIGNINFV